MKEYQYISIFKIFLLYIISFIPTWIGIFQKSTYTNKNEFLKRNCLLIFFEIVIFSIIYFFSKEIVVLFSSQTNIQNYMIYSLKILFIASVTTVIHYSIPLYFIFEHKKTGMFLWLFKLAYIPVMLISYYFFDTKGALFSIPLCDILYNTFLIYNYKKHLHIEMK